MSGKEFEIKIVRIPVQAPQMTERSRMIQAKIPEDQFLKLEEIRRKSNWPTISGFYGYILSEAANHVKLVEEE